MILLILRQLSIRVDFFSYYLVIAHENERYAAGNQFARGRNQRETENNDFRFVDLPL